MKYLGLILFVISFLLLYLHIYGLLLFVVTVLGALLCEGDVVYRNYKDLCRYRRRKNLNRNKK